MTNSNPPPPPIFFPVHKYLCIETVLSFLKDIYIILFYFILLNFHIFLCRRTPVQLSPTNICRIQQENFFFMFGQLEELECVPFSFFWSYAEESIRVVDARVQLQ